MDVFNNNTLITIFEYIIFEKCYSIFDPPNCNNIWLFIVQGMWIGKLQFILNRVLEEIRYESI